MFATGSCHTTDMLPKRKYAEVSSQDSVAPEITKYFCQYQTLDAEQCMHNLLSFLDNKSTCKRFDPVAGNYPTCHNMVATLHVETKKKKIDLKKIADCTSNTNYDRKRFAAITIRIDEPKTTALLFSSGKLVITGSLSRQMSTNAAYAVLTMLKDLFPFEEFYPKNYAIQNIVCNFQAPGVKEIDLDSIYKTLATTCTYQPSIFPGLIYRPLKSPIVLLIFKSSRIVVTGAKCYQDVVNDFDQILETIKPFFVYDVR